MAVTPELCARFYKILKDLEEFDASWPPLLIKSFGYDPLVVFQGLDNLEFLISRAKENPAYHMSHLRMGVEGLASSPQ